MFKNALLIACATLLLLFLGLDNGFPILYPDTGTYIRSGFTGEVPMDRPIFYGLFIRHVSLAESLWLVVALQAGILAWLLFKTVQRWVTPSRLPAYYLLLIGALLWMTSLAYYANVLIPDIFTTITFLSAFQLAFWDTHKWPVRIALALIFVFALITHLSHLPTMLVTLGILAWVAWRQRKREPAPIALRHAGLVLGLILTAMAIVPSYNLAAEGHFRMSGGSSIFMTNRLRDLYLVRDFLAQDCEHNAWKLCPYRDSLVGDFLWDYNHSPLYRTGGWEANTEEYARMNRSILTKPKFLMRYLRGTFEDGIRCFFSFYAGPVIAWGDESGPAISLRQHLPRSWPAYRGTKQYRNQLNLDDSNARQSFFALGSMLVLVVGLIERKRIANLPSDLRWLLYGVVTFALSNATVCASLSNADARYAGRVVWLFPMIVLLVLFAYAERHDWPGRLVTWLKGGQPNLPS